jgi:hypothetical protein
MQKITDHLFCGFCLHSFEEDKSVLRTYKNTDDDTLKEIKGYYYNTDKGAIFASSDVRFLEGHYNIFSPDLCMYCERAVMYGQLAQVFRLKVEDLPLRVNDPSISWELKQLILYRIEYGIETFKGLPAFLEPILKEAIRKTDIAVFM